MGIEQAVRAEVNKETNGNKEFSSLDPQTEKFIEDAMIQHLNSLTDVDDTTAQAAMDEMINNGEIGKQLKKAESIDVKTLETETKAELNQLTNELLIDMTKRTQTKPDPYLRMPTGSSVPPSMVNTIITKLKGKITSENVKNVKIVITGFASWTGGRELNEKLAGERSSAVKEAIMRAFTDPKLTLGNFEISSHIEPSQDNETRDPTDYQGVAIDVVNQQKRAEAIKTDETTPSPDVTTFEDGSPDFTVFPTALTGDDKLFKTLEKDSNNNNKAPVFNDDSATTLGLTDHAVSGYQESDGTHILKYTKEGDKNKHVEVRLTKDASNNTRSLTKHEVSTTTEGSTTTSTINKTDTYKRNPDAEDDTAKLTTQEDTPATGNISFDFANMKSAITFDLPDEKDNTSPYVFDDIWHEASGIEKNSSAQTYAEHSEKGKYSFKTNELPEDTKTILEKSTITHFDTFSGKDDHLVFKAEKTEDNRDGDDDGTTTDYEVHVICENENKTFIVKKLEGDDNQIATTVYPQQSTN